ncbi:hypothetical protein V8D89_009872 [Ganoderma adspersum]
MPPSNNATPEIPLALLTASQEDTTGALLVGTFCALILYGIALNQLYRYLLRFTSDDRYVQVIVFIVMVCETVHCISMMHASYFTVVSTIAQKEELLTHGLWSDSAVPLASGPIFLVAQTFFARRVWLIGPRYQLIIGVAAILLVTEFGFAIAICYESIVKVLAINTGGVRWLVTTGLSIAFAADLLFTPTLTVALWRSRRGHQGKRSVSEVLSTYVVNTGLLHCIFNGAAAIMVIAIRLYANSLLSALNSRDPQKAPSIFDSGSYGRNLIQRMNHRAAAETWNVPQIPDEPEVIHISITTEDEGTRRDPPFKRGFAPA